MSRTEQGRAARKQGVDYESPPHQGRAKNTRRWCLGKVGREHVTTWKPKRQLDGVLRKNEYWLVFSCDTCGKELDWCYPWRWELNKPGKGGCARGCNNKHKVAP